MVRSRCLLTAVSVCLIAWLGSGAASSRSLGREVSVAKLRDGKVLEVTTDDGRKRFCWFEAKCDPLVRKHVLGQIEREEYRLFKMGAKMPPDPEVAMKTGDRMPAEDVPCWQTAAATMIDGDLWIALHPIFKPRVQWWTGHPPHPHHVASGGDPYEGGIVRVDLKTMATQRWTSAGGLPPELVCHDAKDGGPLPEKIVLGAVVSEIGREGGHVVFTTRNNSRVRFEPAKKAWTAVRSGEPEDLLELLRGGQSNRAYRDYAIGQLGRLRATCAIPTLVEILASRRANPGMEHRIQAAEALIAIDDKSAIEHLRPLSGHEFLLTRQYARGVIQAIETPYGRPVEGLRFRLTAFGDPALPESSIDVRIWVRNVSSREITFRYLDDWPLSSHLILKIRREDGSAIQRETDEVSRHKTHGLKPGEVVRLGRYVEPLPTGRYHIKYRISIPAKYAEDSRRRSRRGNIWHGTATTNEISVEVLKPPEDRGGSLQPRKSRLYCGFPRYKPSRLLSETKGAG